jgi:hypothetical protein
MKTYQRQYTISLDGQTYGDGVTYEEIHRMAFAEAEALRSRFPDADIRVTDGPSSGALDDPTIHEYAVAIWDSILSRDANPTTIVASWQSETVKTDPRD